MERHDRWYQQEQGEAHESLAATLGSLEDTQSAVLDRALEHVSVYENRRIEDLSADAFVESRSASRGDWKFGRLRWNIPRSLCLTLQAKIAGKQRPKPQFMTSGADWATKRKAVKLDRLVEAVLHQRQGTYADAWELGQEAFLDATKVGVGAIKVWGDPDEQRVVLERVLVPGRLFIDPNDGEDRCPRNLFHTYPYDLDELIGRFPEQSADIMGAKRWSDMRLPSAPQVAEQVKVYESWRLPVDDEHPGRHVIATNTATLVDEEWTRDEFPFVFIYYVRETVGMGSTSLIEEVADLSEEVNDVLDRMRISVRLTSMGVCFYQRGTIEEVDLVDNRDAINIPFDPGGPVPQWQSPSPFGPAQLDWLKMQVEKLYELPGISQMSATSRKEQGVTAAVAMRTLADMETERFSVIFRQYEQLFVDLARHIVACVRDVAEDNDFTIKWPGQEFLSEIAWSKVNLEDDQYVIQVAPVSGLKNTPADRLQTGEEMFGAGLIGPEALARIKEHLDPKSELEHINRQREVVDAYIETWLDATPDEIEANEQEDNGRPVWVPPITFMGHEDALIQIANAYMKAELDGAPDENKNLFLRYMKALDRQITKKAARMAAIEQGIDPNAPPPAAPPPGAAPPGPPPPAAPPALPAPPPEGAPPMAA